MRVVLAVAAAWCEAGIRQAEFLEQLGQNTASVVLLQAPLFSTNPKIGKKAGWLDLYHTAALFAAGDRTWTLEFDAVTNVAGSALPRVNGSELTWTTDARWCLTEGTLHNRSHWTKTYQTVAASVSPKTMAQLATFVTAANASAPGGPAQYNLFHVTGGQAETLDVTCGNGIAWLLNYLQDTLKTPLALDPPLRYTRVHIRAAQLEKVDPANATQWQGVVAFFTKADKVVGPGLSAWGRLQALTKVLPLEYTYDTNERTYWKIVGDHFPYVHFTMNEEPLQPWPYPVPAGLPCVGCGPAAAAVLV